MGGLPTKDWNKVHCQSQRQLIYQDQSIASDTKADMDLRGNDVSYAQMTTALNATALLRHHNPQKGVPC